MKTTLKGSVTLFVDNIACDFGFDSQSCSSAFAKGVAG
jgi:hypothetical protein